jgi:hypothetical protein
MSEPVSVSASVLQVVVGCADGSLHLVDISTSQVTQRLAGHKGMVQNIRCWATICRQPSNIRQEEQHEAQHTEQGQQQQQQQQQLPAEVWMVSAGEDARVQLWKLLPAAVPAGAAVAHVQVTEQQQQQRPLEQQQEQQQQEQQQGVPDAPDQATPAPRAASGMSPGDQQQPEVQPPAPMVWSCSQRPAAVVLLPVPSALSGPAAHRAKPWAALQLLAVHKGLPQQAQTSNQQQVATAAAGVGPSGGHQLLFGVGGYRGEVLLLSATVGEQ